MDPITLIVSAIVAGAAAASQHTIESAAQDAYEGLKGLLIRKFGGKADVAAAVAGVEAKPDSNARKEVLQEELQGAGAGDDPDVLAQAQALLNLLKGLTGDTVTAGDNSVIAQGGSVAGGAGSVNVRGDVHGGISMGGGGATPAPAPPSSRQSLQTQLDKQQALLDNLQSRLILASGGEAARLESDIDETKAEIRRLQRALDDLQ